MSSRRYLAPVFRARIRRRRRLLREKLSVVRAGKPAHTSIGILKARALPGLLRRN
jgi:hypothetical protein